MLSTVDHNQWITVLYPYRLSIFNIPLIIRHLMNLPPPSSACRAFLRTFHVHFLICPVLKTGSPPFENKRRKHIIVSMKRIDKRQGERVGESERAAVKERENFSAHQTVPSDLSHRLRINFFP